MNADTPNDNDDSASNLNYQPELGSTSRVTKCTISGAPSIIDMGHSDISLQVGNSVILPSIRTLTIYPNQVNNTIFKTHKHILCKFTQLDIMLQHPLAGPDPPIILNRDENGVEDFVNTFKILYAT